MQLLDTELSESQLAQLVDPEGSSLSVWIEDTPDRLVAHPRGIPLWFVTVCVVIPGVLLIGALVYAVIHEGFHPFSLILGIAMSIPAAAFVIGLVWLINRERARKGDFFILDKIERTLTLPRSNVQLPYLQIQRFVEVHSWYKEGKGSEATITWLAELSVLVPAEEGKFARYSVIVCEYSKHVHRIGDLLSEFFGVERQVLKWNWRTRRRLKGKYQAFTRV